MKQQMLTACMAISLLASSCGGTEDQGTDKDTQEKVNAMPNENEKKYSREAPDGYSALTNDYFSILVPQGWTTEKNQPDQMLVKYSDEENTLAIDIRGIEKKGEMDLAAIAEASLIQNFEKTMKNFKVISKEEKQYLGHPAYYLSYSGTHMGIDMDFTNILFRVPGKDILGIISTSKNAGYAGADEEMREILKSLEISRH